MNGPLMLAVFVIGWEVLWWKLGVQPISPMRLKRMLNDPGEDRPFLIDVRTASEFKHFRIEGAENRPGLLWEPGELDTLDKKSPLVVVCLSGHRSPIVAFRLKRRGFQNVSYLSWGMLAWIVTGGHVARQ